MDHPGLCGRRRNPCVDRLPFDDRPPARRWLFPSRARRRPATDFSFANSAISVQRAIRRLCRPDHLLWRCRLRRARTRLLCRPRRTQRPRRLRRCHQRIRAGLGIDSGLAQHLALSLLWTAYASGLIALGVKRESALLRWQALVLFGLVVVKVFIYDSSFLERFYRIVSFFILGLVLLTVSFLYQRKVARGRSPS